MADWYVSSAAWTAIAQFAASGVYTVGQIVRPLTAPTFAAQYAFRCTTAGTASTEPTWPGANNATVTTGGATFTNVSGQSAYGWSAAAGNLYCMGSGGGGYRAVPGDRFFLSSDHSESFGGGSYQLTSNFGTVTQIISVNRAGNVPPQAGDYTAGATITASGNIQPEAATPLYWQGITLSTGGTIVFNGNTNKTHYMRNCAIVLTGSGSHTGFNNPSGLTLDNTTVSFNNANQYIAPGGGSYNSSFSWINTPSAILGTAVPTTLLQPGGNGVATLRGVDLSALTTQLVNGGTGVRLLLDSCRVAPGLTRYPTPGAPTTWSNDEVELVNCFDGSNIINERHLNQGDVTLNRTTAMVGGAQDDVGLFSLQLSANGNADFVVATLDSFWMDVENTYTGSTRTATVEINSGVPLNNTDIALALEYQGTSGSSLATLASTLPNALTASAVLPTSSASWNNPPAVTGTIGFDSTANPSNCVVSNNRMTATAVATGDEATRTSSSFTAGKIYFEITCNVIGASTNTKVGIVNQNKNLQTWIGSDANGHDYYAGGGIQAGGSTLNTTQATWTAGDTICIGVDYANQKIWYRKNGGQWDNTTDNPATNTGGYSLTTMLAAGNQVFPAVGFYNATDRFTINLGAAGFAQAVPAGFTGFFGSAGVGAQHLQVTFTPQQAGRVRGVVRFGRPITTVFVNPQIIVT